MDLLRKVLDWSPIVQGAIGSALFWLVLVAMQKVVDKSLVSFGKARGLRTKERLYQELVHEKMMRQHTHISMTSCIYQALSYMARGAVLLGFGVMFAAVTPVFLAVGGMGFVYYAYRGLRWLKPFTIESDKSELETWERIRDIETQLSGAPEKDTLAHIEALKSKAAQHTQQ